jgi:hypothetical protein
MDLRDLLFLKSVGEIFSDMMFELSPLKLIFKPIFGNV